jgi:hypothetical protein
MSLSKITVFYPDGEIGVFGNTSVLYEGSGYLIFEFGVEGGERREIRIFDMPYYIEYEEEG